MGKSFFNTINIFGKKLKTAEANAENQEAKILEVFKANPTSAMTPFEVQAIFQKSYLKEGQEVPITSIRRGITNLVGKGKLTKTEKMKKGNYGMENHLWKLDIA